MSITVRYLDTPEGVQQAARVSCEAEQPFSDYNEIIAGVQDVPYATLEPGLWTLDGTRQILPDYPGTVGVGWWSEKRSGEEGRFEVPPQIFITFPEPYTATGITFVFSPSTEQWCSEIGLRWYRDQTLLTELSAYPDGPEWILEQLVESFNRIEIDLLTTNDPGQFAKIQMIQIGRVVVFGKNELTQVRLTNEVDPSLCVLSVDTMRVEIRDRKDRAFAPQENQRMELYRNGELLAAHYIMDGRREGKYHYTFSCQSVIGLLGDEYLGGMYEDFPVDEFLDDVLDGRGYVLDGCFDDYKVTGYLPVCTRREALQQLAFAMGAMITTQGTDLIHLMPIPENFSGAFEHRHIFQGAKAEIKPRIFKIQVDAHSYAESDEVDTLMYAKEINGEEKLFTFQNPHYDYDIEGGAIVGSGVNWVKITADGPVTLRGRAYIHNTERVVKQNPVATATERNNVLTVDTATLVSRQNVQAVLERLYISKQLRQIVTQDVVVSGHRSGHKVSSDNPWGTQTHGFIASMESTLTQNGHTATVEILGVEVAAESMYYHSDKEVQN